MAEPRRGDGSCCCRRALGVPGGLPLYKIWPLHSASRVEIAESHRGSSSRMGPPGTAGPDGPVPGPARIRPRSWGVRRRGPAKSAGVSRSPANFGSRPDPPRPASKAIRLGLYTCILYLCIYAYIYIYIYGFLVCRYARSLRLAARQNTPAFDGAFYRPNGTSYQLQPSFHTYSTEPEPTARARRAGKELY